MRSGYFKERYSELIVLTDSPAVKAWTGVLLVALVAAPTLLGVDLSSDRAFYWFCLLMAVLAMLATLNFRRSYIGRALVAIRDNDIAARTMGINLVRFKLLAFLVSAALTGLAGALMGMYLSFISVESYPFLLSIEALAIIIVGGLGSVLGAVLGTVFIVTLPDIFNAAMS